MHDMAITEHYAVFLDLHLLFKPERMLKGNLPLFYDETQEARFDSHYRQLLGPETCFGTNVASRFDWVGRHGKDDSGSWLSLSRRQSWGGGAGG